MLEVWLENGIIRRRGDAVIRRVFVIKNGKIFDAKVDSNGRVDGNGCEAIGLEFYGNENVYGFSKEYLSNDFKSLGFEFEIIPKGVKDGCAVVETLYRGRTVPCELKVRNGKKLTIIFTNGREVVELGKGTNVLTAKMKINGSILLSTLTIVQ